jgi:hypothetical protein
VSSKTPNSDGEPGDRPNTERRLEVGERCGPDDYRKNSAGQRLQLTALYTMRTVEEDWPPIFRAVRTEVETGWVGAPPAVASARPVPERSLTLAALRSELDGIQIHSLNIGEIRARYLIDEDSEWNAWVRDETAAREGKNRTAKCPHCQHFGPVDHECSHETCQNCGMALDEPPVVDPPDDGKLSSEELRQMREAEGEPAGHVGGTFLAGPNSAEWHPDGFGGEDPAPREIHAGTGAPCPYGTCPPSGCLAGTAHGCRGPVGEPGRGILTGTDIPPVWSPTPDGTICPGCNSPIVGESCQCSVRGPVRGQIVGRLLESCDIIEASDLTENASGQMDTVPSVWVGNRVGQTAIYRPVRNGEISPQPKSRPPAWFGPALLEARCKDLANAGHRLAKCATCSGLLYEKDGNWFHAGPIPAPFHVSAPVEIYTAAPVNTFGIAPAPWMSNWDRLMLWLFPRVEVELPEAPAEWVDVIHFDSVTHFSFLDRLRLLVSGRLHTRALIVCQNLVGQTKSVSASRPLAPGRGRE